MEPSWRDQIERARQQAASAKVPEDDDLANEAGEAPPPPPFSEPIADEFSDFQIVRELHRGGQGIVYLAIEDSTQRKVALKVLLAGVHASPSALKRFDREVQLAARLSHPNIISILRSGVSQNGQPFYAMDYCRGLPLDQYVRENRLEATPALELFAKVCHAVSHAHQKGVIHRDLKPSNVLVDADGEPRVLDFGLAKQLAGPDELNHTVTGSPIGTVAYMSPEQVRGNPEEVDTRTDVYALGIILYTLMTGSFPYPVHVAMADVFNHISDTDPRKPSRVWDASAGVRSKLDSTSCPLDHEVETIILKSIEKQPDRRYQFAGDLGRDIERYLRGEAIEAKGDSLGYKISKATRKHWLAVSVLAGYLLLTTTGFFVAMWSLQRVRKANAEEARQRQVAEIQQQVLDQKATAYERSLPRLVRKMDELLVDDESTLDDATRGALNYELASVHSSLSDFSKAEAYGKEALNLGDEAAQGRAKLLLSDIYTQRGDYAQAEQLLRTINTKNAGPRLALVLKYLERYDESEQLYLSQLDEFSAEPESKARVLNNLGSLYYEKEDYAAAIARLRQAFTIRESLLSAAENERARSRFEKQLMTTQSNLGGCLTMAGKLDEAESLLTEVVTRARSTYPKGHDLLSHFLLYSGRLKVKQKRFAAAEVDLKEAYLINQRHFGADHKWTREVVEWLIELYSSWGKPELAKSYYKTSSSTISDETPAAKKAR